MNASENLFKLGKKRGNKKCRKRRERERKKEKSVGGGRRIIKVMQHYVFVLFSAKKTKRNKVFCSAVKIYRNGL